jgi:hypothetical protein
MIPLPKLIPSQVIERFHVLDQSVTCAARFGDGSNGGAETVSQPMGLC